MRNLKRALSLALASIMLLGMMVTAVNLEIPVKLPGSTSEPLSSLQIITAISARVTTFVPNFFIHVRTVILAY